MSQRTARFVSAIAVVFPDGKEFVVRGTCEGNIGFEEKGKNGFGYDSLFIVNGYNKTFAEIPATIKNAISHRANALNLMKEEFKKRVGKIMKIGILSDTHSIKECIDKTIPYLKECDLIIHAGDNFSDSKVYT